MSLDPSTLSAIGGGALVANAGLGLWLIKSHASLRERVARLESTTEHLPCEKRQSDTSFRHRSDADSCSAD